MTRRSAPPIIALLLLAAVGLANAGPTPQGLATDNVEWIGSIPGVVDGVGGRVVGDHFYLTDQSKLMIFDISTPALPVLMGTLPAPQEWLFAAEDIDTDGNTLLMPAVLRDFGPTVGAGTRLYIVDVSDKRLPVITGIAENAASHTVACAASCALAYSSKGTITDVSDPRAPIELGTNGPRAHDIDEIRPGLLLDSELEAYDIADPAKPVRVASRKPGKGVDGNHCWHTARWPHDGADRFILCTGESNFKPSCGVSSGAFSTWDTTGWETTGHFVKAGEFRLQNGTVTDGSPPRAVFGCSAHWLDPHPTFRDGGLVAVAWYEHGTRFLRVATDGSVTEEGWFLPFGGSTGAAYWITDEIVYAVDYNRGLDILRVSVP